jgi:hypothetical protein
MLSTSLNNNPVSVQNTLARLSDSIKELDLLFYNKSCPTNYDISNQIPLWVIYEKQERESAGNSGISLFDFVQKYYDWLYCDESSGAQYELSKRLLDIVDVDKTRTKFLERLSGIYANGFDTAALESNGGLVTEDSLRRFIKGIKRAFYHKKTTEDGIKYFFHTLFGVDEEDITIQAPKKYILRLNGGKFANDNFSFMGQSAGDYDVTNALSGSYLNGSRLQDGNWIQDWSYLLKVGVPATEYKTSYLEMAHPAGLKVVFEKTLADYQGPTYDDTAATVCDSAFLRNYAPYGISFNYSGQTATSIAYSGFWGAVSGLTLLALNRSTGCCGASFAGFTGITNVFPNWSDETNYTKSNFKEIYISTMFELCYPSEAVGSPNDGFACS